MIQTKFKIQSMFVYLALLTEDRNASFADANALYALVVCDVLLRFSPFSKRIADKLPFLGDPKPCHVTEPSPLDERGEGGGEGREEEACTADGGIHPAGIERNKYVSSIERKKRKLLKIIIVHSKKSYNIY